MLGINNKLFVFDIEAVPDIESVKNLTSFESNDPKALEDELKRYHLEITDGKNDFLRQPFWRVVAISFLEAEISQLPNGEEKYTFKRLMSNNSDDEKEMLKGFFNYFNKNTPRLVSYNGKGYDLPVLKFRGMKYGIQSKALHDKTNKWDNYQSRYSTNYHCDLNDVLRDFGSVPGGLKLNEICSILGFAGKFGVDGSKVSEMYQEGKLKEIKDYCETDVLNTYLVYLRNQHHTGVLSTENYNEEVENIIAYLEENADEKTHLGDFLEAWFEASNGDNLLD